MGVRRVELPFEGHFTQIPNAWLRDQRLSRRARGLLGEIMTHRVGWHVTISSLQKAGNEGRDAIRTALLELREAGYLKLAQTRGDGGRFNEVEYELCAPAITADGFSDTGGFTAVGSADVGSPDVGESDTKKTIYSEDHLKEHDTPLPPAGVSRGEVVVSGAGSFESFYEAYPRHTGRAAAERAFAKALRVAPAERIVAGARRFAADPNLPPREEARFIPHPATWLNAGRWDDDALPARGGGRGQEKQQQSIELVRSYQQREEQEHEEVRAGDRPRLGLVR
ncbi:hypothetical protein EDF38_1285 [Frigoribacterium sp. PhB160]|uniref:helix-turn-helix domain-containing protein n=1 Tax=Frigoribacterium sp. PhB160 TaxID=2485192 RepID=UPI000F4A2B00|nr:helix-turn-helix domain-containing protein [Frigoribacterium sp. PhB160]ROS62182.1 hypothetical protein EDF38_1285 [Frigoribacterium sp. PhB160]